MTICGKNSLKRYALYNNLYTIYNGRADWSKPVQDKTIHA